MDDDFNPHTSPPSQAPPPPAWLNLASRRPSSPQRTMHFGLTLLTLGILAAATIVAFVSVLDIVDIWFRERFEPIARTVLSLIVAVLALYVLQLLMRRKLD